MTALAILLFAATPGRANESSTALVQSPETCLSKKLEKALQSLKTSPLANRVPGMSKITSVANSADLSWAKGKEPLPKIFGGAQVEKFMSQLDSTRTKARSAILKKREALVKNGASGQVALLDAKVAESDLLWRAEQKWLIDKNNALDQRYDRDAILKLRERFIELEAKKRTLEHEMLEPNVEVVRSDPYRSLPGRSVQSLSAELDELVKEQEQVAVEAFLVEVRNTSLTGEKSEMKTAVAKEAERIPQRRLEGVEWDRKYQGSTDYGLMTGVGGLLGGIVGCMAWLSGEASVLAALIGFVGPGIAEFSTYTCIDRTKLALYKRRLKTFSALGQYQLNFVAPIEAELKASKTLPPALDLKHLEGAKQKLLPPGSD